MSIRQQQVARMRKTAIKSTAEAEPVRYRLLSNEGVYTPGVVRWAKEHYWHEPDRPQLRKVIMGWNIPEDHADALLSGRVDYRVDGEAVIFEVSETTTQGKK
jgi:hypothetical protein